MPKDENILKEKPFQYPSIWSWFYVIEKQDLENRKIFYENYRDDIICVSNFTFR
jgi:hypothetical protein